MSAAHPMAVVRVGQSGPLHIAWVEPDGYDTLCDRTLTGPRLTVFTKRERAAAKAWRALRHCARCELEHELRVGG